MRGSAWCGSALSVLLASAVSIAQVNGFGFGGAVAPHGVPASVTSFGFGGHPGFHGVPASVTSVTFGSAPQINVSPFGFRHHRDHFTPFFGGGYYVPYAYPVDEGDYSDMDSPDEEDYRGGPTIFDRRGPGGPYAERSRDSRGAGAAEDYRATTPENDQRVEEAPSPEVSEQPRTLLVFKDGHQMEVSNYAIIGPTLYDLSDGHTRKIQLAELDLAATVKQNDQRGVEFELPRAGQPD
ncbi:MAG TPA: hypothetical protein VM711_05540 [Sphingomicrobium sp.]|nr:hypothetical protein [Sphingomicrobium sp.]